MVDGDHVHGERRYNAPGFKYMVSTTLCFFSFFIHHLKKIVTQTLTLPQEEEEEISNSMK